MVKHDKVMVLVLSFSSDLWRRRDGEEGGEKRGEQRERVKGVTE